MQGFVALVEGGEVSVGWRGLACSERNNAEHALELSKSKKTIEKQTIEWCALIYIRLMLSV